MLIYSSLSSRQEPGQLGIQSAGKRVQNPASNQQTASVKVIHLPGLSFWDVKALPDQPTSSYITPASVRPYLVIVSIPMCPNSVELFCFKLPHYHTMIFTREYIPDRLLSLTGLILHFLKVGMCVQGCSLLPKKNHWSL